MRIYLNTKTLTLALGALVFVGGIYFCFEKFFISDLKKQGAIGEYILNDDFSKQPLVSIEKKEDKYQLLDSSGSGPAITYAKSSETGENGKEESSKNDVDIEFPENYDEPISIKLDEQRVIQITDNNEKKFSSKLITEKIPLVIRKNESEGEDGPNEEDAAETVFQKKSYLKYQDKRGRVSVYYAFQKGDDKRKLKHWNVYAEPRENNSEESESYKVSNAKLKLNARGEVEVYYFSENALKNEQALSNVDQSLIERARRVVQEDGGQDILNSGNSMPELIIPKPFYVNGSGQKKYLDWTVDGDNISLKFHPEASEYPVALDPTVEFVYPGQGDSNAVISPDAADLIPSAEMNISDGDLNADGINDLVISNAGFNSYTGKVYIFFGGDNFTPFSMSGADVKIDGTVSNEYFGSSLLTGDFNDDGKTDLVVGAYKSPASNTGKVYIFYNDGSIPTAAANADLIIAGESIGNYFGCSMASADFNDDGKKDLIVGAYGYSSLKGRIYVFYNDGSIPTNATDADIKIDGDTSSYLGKKMIVGDLNHDGKDDLVSSHDTYGSGAGIVYIFYNDGSIPATAATADVIISGEAASYFGCAMIIGDFNADGKTDLAVGAWYYASYTGRVYIFYDDGSIPTSAAAADTIISGETTSVYLGYTLDKGDFNADGKTDLVVGASGYSANKGAVFIFYNDGNFPASSAGADVSIIGEVNAGYFGKFLRVGEFNGDSAPDIASIAPGYNAVGEVYIFFNDGSIPSSVTDRDEYIYGEYSSPAFGSSMVSGDFNADGQTDLAVGASSFTYTFGKIYIFYGNGSISTNSNSADAMINGVNAAAYLGKNLLAADVNNDGRTDLVAGSSSYSSSTGQVYIFYNDGSYPKLSSSADVIITGEATNNKFGTAFIDGDFNNDGKTDLAVGAIGYSLNKGRVYIFYDGSFPESAADADVKIDGEASSQFGNSLATGDFNNDGADDLVVGAFNYNKAYIIYSDGGTYPAAASSADVVITGEASSYFGNVLATGDLDGDGKKDLVVGVSYYAGNYYGKIYVFYNDGSMPASAADADYAITGEFSNSYFGEVIQLADYNNDGKKDIISGSKNYNKAYIFYGGGSYPSISSSADMIIDGAASGVSFASGDFNGDGADDLVMGGINDYVYFFYSQTGQVDTDGTNGSNYSSYLSDYMVSGDFDNDGTIDLAMSSVAYTTNTGRVYIFYNDGSMGNFVDEADVVIEGQATGNRFGCTLAAEDFNADNKTDLVVGAYGYSSNTGRAYIFYNDGSYPSAASSADVIITGEASSYFGISMTTGDFDSSGTIDLAVGGYYYTSGTGRAYIFYNDGSIPTTAATADVIIAGEGTNNYFGISMISGDFNGDTATDLAVGAYYYSTQTGRAYIFYNDGSIPTTAATADVIITGETTNNYFGWSMTSGDFNGDTKTDLAVGAYYYTNQTGRVYIFYNDGSMPTTAATADVIITGEAAGNYFGKSMVAGDFNSDGKTDLVVSAAYYSNQTGRIYIFYNDGSIPTVAASADVIINGEQNSARFGEVMATGDLNSDGKKDLIVSAQAAMASGGRVYIFYSDGSYESSALDAADNFITGNYASGRFGTTLVADDLNGDGKTDLVVGANVSIGGRVYIFYNTGSLPGNGEIADKIIEGEYSSYFGTSIAIGDFNADGKKDLAVGAYLYSTNTGRAYIFYNDGSYPYNAKDADVIMTGENSSRFGYAMLAEDFNGDGKVDLCVGGYSYATSTGRAYIFYNDGSIPTTAATADVIITGEAGSYFAFSMTALDLNYDGKKDLIVGGYNASKVYVFYNDGSIPTTLATADVTISGDSGSYFGYSLAGGDLNGDGKDDLVVGAQNYSTNIGRVYVFYSGGSLPANANSADVIITGSVANTYLGYAVLVSDLNSDGKNDLVVSSNESSSAGKIYIFKNNGTISSDINSAFMTAYGEGPSSYFGRALLSADVNYDGRNELVVGSYGYLGGKIYYYELDASGTKSNYVDIQGGMQFEGGVTLN